MVLHQMCLLQLFCPVWLFCLFSWHCLMLSRSFLILMKSSLLIISLMDHAFGVASKESSSYPRSFRFSPMLSSRRFIVLPFQWSLGHFKLILYMVFTFLQLSKLKSRVVLVQVCHFLFSSVYFVTSHFLSSVLSFPSIKWEYYNRCIQYDYFLKVEEVPCQETILAPHPTNMLIEKLDYKDCGHHLVDSPCYLTIYSYEENASIRKYSKDLRENSF